jgi:hypothetical protein
MASKGGKSGKGLKARSRRTNPNRYPKTYYCKGRTVEVSRLGERRVIAYQSLGVALRAAKRFETDGCTVRLLPRRAKAA